MASPSIIVVAGVRPQYIKAKAVQWLLERYAPKVIGTVAFVDVAQHYTHELSDLVMDDLGINFTKRMPPSNSHLRGVIIGNAIAALAQYFDEQETSPTIVVFGDAASVVAGAFAAHNAGLPLIHIEAGARRDPREIEHYNSVIVDQLATVRLPYSQRALQELTNERLSDDSIVVGDVALEWYLHRYPHLFARAQRKNIDAPILVSMHRPGNMDEETLLTLITELQRTGLPVRWLSFPRNLPFVGMLSENGATILPMLTHSAAMAEISEARMLVTDSGGLSREAHYLHCPVIMRRDLGGWPELAASGFLYSLIERSAQAVGSAIDWGLAVTSPDYTSSPLYIEGGGRLIAETITTARVGRHS